MMVSVIHLKKNDVELLQTSNSVRWASYLVRWPSNFSRWVLNFFRWLLHPLHVKSMMSIAHLTKHDTHLTKLDGHRIKLDGRHLSEYNVILFEMVEWRHTWLVWRLEKLNAIPHALGNCHPHSWLVILYCHLNANLSLKKLS